VTARVTVTVTVLDAARNVVLSRPEPDILKRKEKNIYSILLIQSKSFIFGSKNASCPGCAFPDRRRTARQ
jgi:hypothetical protein